MPLLSRYGVLRSPGVPSLFVVAFFARLPHAMSGVILTLHTVTTLDRSYAEAGLVMASFTIGIAVGAPWRGRAVDRYGLRRAVLPSVLVETAVWLAVPWLEYQALVAAAFVGGLFLVPVYSVTRQALAVLVPTSGRDEAFAMDAVSAEVTFMVGPVLGVLLATGASTSVGLIATGLATAVAGVGLMIFNPLTRSGEPISAVHNGWKPDGRLWVVLVAGLSASVLLVGTDVSIIAVLNEAGRSRDVGWIVALWAFGSMVGGLWYAGSRVRVSPIVLTVVMGLLTLPAIAAQGSGWLALAVFVAGLPCAPALSAINSRLVEHVPEHRRGEVMGWSGTVQTAGSALGAPVVGAVIDHSASHWGFLAAVVLSLFALGLGAAAVQLRRTEAGAAVPS